MTFPKQHSNCGLRSFRPMPVSRCHTAFQLIYLEDNIIFHFTDKDLRFGEVKKENFPCLLPEFHDTCSPQLLHPLLPPNPLLCDYFFLSSRSKPSSFFFFFPGDDTMSASPCDDYLWRNQMGHLGNAPIRKSLSFQPASVSFTACHQAPDTHRGVCSVRFFVC